VTHNGRSKTTTQHNELTSIRLKLFQNGFHPIPTKGKMALVKGWPSDDFIAREMNEKRIESWPRRYPQLLSTGVRVDNGLVVIDGDVDNQELADIAWQVIEAIVPDIAASAPARYGKSEHKFALYARIEGAPFRYEASHGYVTPEDLATWQAALAVAKKGDRVPEPETHRLEIFGSTAGGPCTQHFGIIGPHSYNDDGTVAAEYRWGEGPTLLSQQLDRLPVITHEQVVAILVEFERRVAETSWVPLTEPIGGNSTVAYDITEETRFDTNRGEDQIDYEELCAAFAVYGSALKCSVSFIPGRGDGGRRDHAVVGDQNRHGCVAVYVYGDAVTHFPAHLAKPGDTIEEEIEAVGAAVKADKKVLPFGVSISDFYAFMPKHLYIFAPTGDLWPAASLDARLPKIPLIDARGQPVLDKKGNPKTMPPHLWLDRNRPVEQMTWVPGEPQAIAGRLAAEGGWVVRKGVTGFNLYRPPQVKPGDASKADRWLELVHRLYPEGAQHIVAFCAHRIQRPAEKINHALVLAGSPGIGKDTLLQPLKHGVGEWNFAEVSPIDIVSPHNDYVRSVVLRISEARDLGDVNRYAFHETTKALMAAPPDMLRVNTKYVPQYYVPNLTAVVITTNHGTDGLYLPPDDRRHYVAGTEVTYKDLGEDYLPEIWRWYAAGGLADVVAYLATYDLSKFDPKAPPEKTPAFWRMVDAGAASELPEFRDALEAAGGGTMPAAVTTSELMFKASHELSRWLQEPKNRRTISHRMESCGYLAVRNLDSKEGIWRVGGQRQVIYGKADLTTGDRYRAAEALKRRADDAVKSSKGSEIPNDDVS